MYLITSDSHFGDVSIITHERHTRFSSIESHDSFVISQWDKWMKKLKEDDTFYFLGDFCEIDAERHYVDTLKPMMNAHPCHKVMVKGNHDKNIDRRLLLEIFDEVYDFPIFLSNRVVLSHYPQATYSSQVNVHGHLHGMRLADNNHLCASIHVNNYNAITSKQVESTLGKVDKWCSKFLYEPWAADYLLTQPHVDAIGDDAGRIDLSASRLSHIMQLQGKWRA